MTARSYLRTETHYAEAELDLTPFVQDAAPDQVRDLLKALTQVRSHFTIALTPHLINLIDAGIFHNEGRPEHCVFRILFTYNDPYFSRSEQAWCPQSAADVCSHFQGVIDKVLSLTKLPFSFTLTSPKATAFASTFASFGRSVQIEGFSHYT